MRILHVIDSGGLYGAEMMLLHLAKEQQRQGLSPMIASIGDPGIKEKQLEKEAENRGVPVSTFRMRPGPNYFGAKKVLEFCHTNNFDIIHSHGYKGNILLGFLPRKIRKKPMISTLHGWTSTSVFSKMGIYEWLDARSLKFVDVVVLVNAAMLKRPELSKLNACGKISIIDNGVPISLPDNGQISPLDDDIAAFCLDAFVIGAIGRYSKEKGFDILIESFRHVKANHAKAKLLLIGDGSLHDEYRKIAVQYSLEDSVMFAGYRPSAWRYMTLMNILCIPSRTEGLPITLLEAMRARVPVIASAVGGIPHVLVDRKTGILVPAEKIDTLAKAISSVIKQSGVAEKYAQCAYEDFLAKYSDTVMADKYHQVYLNLSYKPMN
jgi:glycosyltransferase involved in cell wall biosynthesis